MADNKTKKSRKKRRLQILFGAQLVLLVLVLGALSYYCFGGYAKRVKQLQAEAIALVNNSTEETFRATQTSVVYDVNGKEISVVKGEKDSYYLEYDEIPEGVKEAIISIEDKKFEKHKGVDFKAIMRAAVAMVRNRKITQGGSTITQQLARTVFLSNEKSWERKVEEIFIAMGLERRYTKEQILEYYLNNIYFANGYYGIEAASQGYFSCSVKDLDLSRQALLCGIPNNPTVYDPVEHMENAISRRDRILKQMTEDGKIYEDTYEEEKNKTVKLKRPKRQKNDYVETYTYHCATEAIMESEGFEFRDTFDDRADQEMYEQDYEEMHAQCQRSLYTGGYRIYTSIDLDVQKKLQESIDQGLADFDETTAEGVYALQASGVCIDNETGHVRAIVGGRGQKFDGYTLNRAYQSFRQPGSSIKPLIVYTPALERGYSPKSIVNDHKFEGGPSNSGGVYSGEITLRQAVEKSKNTIAWQLLEEMTPKVGLHYIKEMNFAKVDARDEVPAAALGGFTYGTSALEMASGYATIENDGVYRKPTCIERIEDDEGNLIYSPQDEGKTIYEQNAARTMTDILTGVFTRGTAKGLGLGEMPCAGKTGTTNDHKDGWFCGFTGYYTTAIWVGYDAPRRMDDLYGNTYPGHIWQDFMLKLHEQLEPLEFMPYIGYNDTVHVHEEEIEPMPEDEKPADNQPTEPEKPEEPEESEPVDIPGEVEPEEPQPEEPEENPDESDGVIEILPDDPDEPDEEPEEEPEEEEGDVIILP